MNRYGLAGTPDRLEAVDAFAQAQTGNDIRLLMQTIFRNDQADRPSNGFFARIAEQAFGARIPTGDGPIQGLAEDCV